MLVRNSAVGVADIGMPVGEGVRNSLVGSGDHPSGLKVMRTASGVGVVSTIPALGVALGVGETGSTSQYIGSSTAANNVLESNCVGLIIPAAKLCQL